MAAEECQCTGEKTSILSSSVRCAIVIMQFDTEKEHQSQFNASWSLTCVSFGKKWLRFIQYNYKYPPLITYMIEKGFGCLSFLAFILVIQAFNILQPSFTKQINVTFCFVTSILHQKRYDGNNYFLLCFKLQA